MMAALGVAVLAAAPPLPGKIGAFVGSLP